MWKVKASLFVGLAAISVAFVALGSATDVETDAAVSRPDGSLPHLKVTAWELRDQTDGVGDLVAVRDWLLLPRTSPVSITGNVVDVQNVVTGSGTVYLRISPLPGSRNWEGPDFVTRPGTAAGVEVVPRPCRTLKIPYSGGTVGRGRL